MSGEGSSSGAELAVCEPHSAGEGSSSGEGHRFINTKITEEALERLSKLEELKLQAVSGTIFTITEKDVIKNIIKNSEVIFNMIEDWEEGDEPPLIPIPIEHATDEAVGLLLEIIEWFKDREIVEIERPMRKSITEYFDEETSNFLKEKGIFCNRGIWGDEADKESYTLLEYVILLTNYLGAVDILQLLCASIADMIKGKSPEEIRELFGLSKEDEEEVSALAKKDEEAE